MFAMILFLLKCIGILLLAIVGILLLIVLTILLSPIRYEANGEKTDKLRGDFRIRWLFGLVSVSGVFQEGEQSPDLDIRIFGKSLTQNNQKKKPKKKKQSDVLYSRETQKPSTQTQPKTPTQTEPPKPKTEKPKIEPTPEPPQKKEGIRRVKLEQIQETPPPDIPKQQPEPTASAGLDDTTTDTPQTEKTWKQWAKQIWAYDQKKATVKAIWRFVKGIAKTILPNHFYFQGTFGTGDPAQTGYLLAMASIWKAKFGENLQIKGDFAKATAQDIIFRCKGRIILGYLAYLTARFALTKPIRQIIKSLWKGRTQNG